MSQWMERYWLEVIFAGALTGLGILLRRINRKLEEWMREHEALQLGMQALLRDRIIWAYNHYMEKGCCPIYGQENIHAMYAQYKILGGNGAVTKLVEDLEDLPASVGSRGGGNQYQT